MYFDLRKLILCVLLASQIYAEELTIEIDGGAVEALPIAVVPFDISGQFEINPAEIIKFDLSMSGKFLPLPEESMISTPTSFEAINFKDWRILGVENLVIGRVMENDNGYVLVFSLIDVFRETELITRKISYKFDSFRKASHHISDLIYYELVGKQGNFSTQIAYVVFKALQNEYQLVVSDYDGYNPKTVFRSDQPLLSPSWSPSGASLAYVSFEDGRSAIFVQELKTGSRQKIRLGKGITGSPAFSPDGKKLVLTSSKEGNSNLYVYNLENDSIEQVTSHGAIDTEGNWSPDGTSLIFTSGRSGGAQIYHIGLDGSSPKRLTFGLGPYNANAEYSQDGESLILISRGGRGHRICLYHTASREWKFLSDSILDESPSFSPNGDMVIYSSKGQDSSKLVVVSTDGSMASRKFTLGEGDIREPAWGPVTD